MDSAIEKLISETQVRHHADELTGLGIREVIEQVATLAYEGAAKAQCALCRHAQPVTVVGSVVNDFVPLGETVYLHRRDNAFVFVDTRCDASRIHALKDSLAQETVSA